jgi:general stress protein 26
LSLAKDDTNSKTGPITSIDEKARTFVVDLPARPLTFTMTDATIYKLDGKDAKMADVVKVGAKVTVAYTRDGDTTRMATKVEATTEKK